MSTRALIKIFDEEGEEICTIYKHRDGHPECLGERLYSILGDKVVSQTVSADRSPLVLDGMNDVAAYVIADLKDGPGDVLVYRAGIQGLWEEYVYEIRFVKFGSPVLIRTIKKR